MQIVLYTRWPILIYNPKYLLKYFTYEKMVLTKVDQVRGGHLTVPSISTLKSIIKVKIYVTVKCPPRSWLTFIRTIFS